MAAPHSTTEPELDDGTIGQFAAQGAAIGLVFMFALVTAMCLLAGASWSYAIAIAIVPGVVAGPFVGGVVALGVLLSKLERQAQAATAPVEAEAEVEPMRRAA